MLAHKIIFEGRRAVGIEYESGGELKSTRVTREVILAAGSINTPQIFARSPRHIQEATGAVGRNAANSSLGRQTLVIERATGVSCVTGRNPHIDHRDAASADDFYRAPQGRVHFRS